MPIMFYEDKQKDCRIMITEMRAIVGLWQFAYWKKF